LVLYAALRTATDAQPANMIALLLTAVANTAANRRLTFGITGPRDLVKHQLQGLIAFGLALVLTGGSLAVLHVLAPSPRRTVELAVLVAANLGATVLRFLLLRAWLYHRGRGMTAGGGSPPPSAYAQEADRQIA
jgi:putative flippase GtrA